MLAGKRVQKQACDLSTVTTQYPSIFGGRFHKLARALSLSPNRRLSDRRFPEFTTIPTIA